MVWVWGLVRNLHSGGAGVGGRGGVWGRLLHTTVVAAKKKARQDLPKAQQLQLLDQVNADTQYLIKQQQTGVLKVFPNVKSTIKNAFHNLSEKLDPSLTCQQTVSAVGRVPKNSLVFKCCFTIKWPNHTTFTGYGYSKKDAELSAITKAADMLYTGKLLSAQGHPITVTAKEKQQCLERWNHPPTIQVPKRLLLEGLELLLQFEEVKGVMDPEPEEDEEQQCAFPHPEPMEDSSEHDLSVEDEEAWVRNLVTGGRGTHRTHHNERRNHQLLTQYQQRQQQATHQPLPMLQYREEVERLVRDHQVLVVAGDTGCGKSTQVPQMLMDLWSREGRGAECNILVSQPRRLAAVSLAKRVAAERGEQVGESVGYQVRLDQRLVRQDGGVLFCTGGMMLEGLRVNPNLAGVSHVVVDEVHERSVSTDMLLLLLRRLLLLRPDLRLVLMSASLNTRELQQYFPGAAELSVPGTCYPLTRHFLPQALNTLGLDPTQFPSPDPHGADPQHCPLVNVKLVVAVVEAIHRTKPPGALLCFLPGWQDIVQVQARLQEVEGLQQEVVVVPLHSQLQVQEQEAVFEEPPPGCRKVVLATNIAETSITIRDIVYVVDTGIQKELRYRSTADLTVLSNFWISRANSEQRAGRAGRLQPGEVFHLYSSHTHSDMAKFPLPEILCISLEEVILQCKAHCGEESVAQFLQEALSVPSPRLVRAAVRKLEDMGVLRRCASPESEALTALGHRILHFPTPPHLSKALVYASIFRCVSPVLTIAAMASSARSIFFTRQEARADIRAVKQQADPTSDLLATCKLMTQVLEHKRFQDRLTFCNNSFINLKALQFAEGVKGIYWRHLEWGLLVDEEELRDESEWNEQGREGQVVLGVLLAGLNRVFTLQRGLYTRGILSPHTCTLRQEDGEVVSPASDSVMYPLPRDKTVPQHLLSLQLRRDAVARRNVAQDLSVLQPLTVALFAGKGLKLNHTEEGCVLQVQGNNHLMFCAQQRTSHFLVGLREAVNQTVKYLIETRGTDSSDLQADTFSDSLVHYVARLLHSQAAKVDAWEEPCEQRDNHLN